LLCAAAAPQAALAASGSDLLAIRVGKAETIAHGTIEHAVILIDGGKITAIGQDLPIERGIPVLDRPQWTAMPGLVHPYSRLGLEGRGGSGFEPEKVPTGELYPLDPLYKDLLERGVTTLGLYPAGTGIPGQAIALRPQGQERAEMLLDESAYLKIEFRADARSKKMVRDAFAKVDEYVEKEKKAREKWEKDAEKAKKKEPEKKPEEKKPEPKPEEKKPEGKGQVLDAAQDPEPQQEPAAAQDPKPEEKKDEGPGPYVPPEPDAKVKPFIALRAKELRALVAISSAADYLHWLDAISKEDFLWDLRLPLTRQADYFEVAHKLGEKQVRLVMEPEITLHPGTMRQRNLPAELARAGAKLVLIPRSDTLGAVETWLHSVGMVVANGLDRQVALRAVTLEPAEVLGLAARVGSLEVGKDANLVFYAGDPLEPATPLEAVMLEGRFVKGEVQQ
jgi:imidazolonepropionase-like amidohydrolase